MCSNFSCIDYPCDEFWGLFLCRTVKQDFAQVIFTSLEGYCTYKNSLYSGTFGIKAELMVTLVRGSEQSFAAEVTLTAGLGADKVHFEKQHCAQSIIFDKDQLQKCSSSRIKLVAIAAGKYKSTLAFKKQAL